MEQYTKADALLVFLTGASSDGGEQSDPDLSLGNYRSSSLGGQPSFLVDNPIPGLKIERVGLGNGLGVGTLEAYDSNQIRWTAPGDTPGAADTIADGQTRMLISGSGQTCQYIVVSCHTDEDLSGSASVTLMSAYNNVIGMSNVPSGSSADKIRCVALKNVGRQKIKSLKIWLATLATQQISDDGQLGGSGAGTIETTGSFSDWPETGFCRITQSNGTLREIVYYQSKTDTALDVPVNGRGLLGTSASAGAATDTLDCVPGLKIATESPVSDQFTEASDEYDTASVSGLSWSTGITKDTGLYVSSLDVDDMIGVWLWLAVVNGRIASPQLENNFLWEYSVYDLEIQPMSLEAGIS